MTLSWKTRALMVPLDEQLARLLAEQDPALWPYRFNSMDARRVLGME